ncbi:glycosyltransferase family 1 protein [candidate division KSB1 bacterium]|nr:glycosyltransferase family 4 protein [candidate division KSB1 bacterium]RQW05520.1 MAG: glycosyltransferase family 1 protein [candidate division KSB1 bacterium]
MSVSRLYNILAINWQDITHPLGGGAEVHFHEIFKRVAAAGHRVTLLSCSYENAPAEETIDGIRIVRRGQRDFFNFAVPRGYRELTAHEHFDIVFDDINKIPFYTPLFVKEPVVAIAHHFFAKSIFLEVSFQYASYVYLSEYLVRFIYRNTPFAVVSNSTRDELLKIGIKAHIELLPNAVDQKIYHVLSNTKSKTPVIGYLGRIKKYKSVDHIIRAMPIILQHIPDVRLKIIGDGDALPELRAIARSLGVEKQIQFTGHVTQNEKVKLINESWVVVNPSSKEGWGLTVIESNACGIPVVAANSPGLRDSVIDGETGTLYDYGNIDYLAHAVVELMQDEKKRNLYAKKARQWSENWNWDHSAQKAITIIEKNVRT